MQIKMIVCFAAVGTLALGTVGCSNKATAKTKKGEIVRTIDTPEAESDRYVQFDGIGAADQTIQNKSQRMSLSESAARKVAEEKMLAYLKGQTIDANTTVEQAVTSNQKIQGIVQQTLRGAMVVKREWTNDDGCVLSIRLDKKKFKDQVMESK